MSEAMGGFRAGITEIPRPDMRFVELSMEEAKSLFAYCMLRQVTPIIGLGQPEKGMRVFDLSKNPLGPVAQSITNALAEANSEGADLVLLGASQEDMSLVFKDFENQADLGDPDKIDKILPMFESIKAKWEGATI